jgi:putative DNA primase/helicase
VNPWPKLRPIRDELPDVEPFRKKLLPDSLRPLALDIAELMQVPLDFPAVVLTLCLAGAVNRRARIQPKAKDTSFIVVPNLWGGIIGPPGIMKSPVLTRVTGLLGRIEEKWQAVYAQQLAEWEKACEQCENDERPEKPVSKRLIINDATPEKLHEILRDNPAGVLVPRDEWTGWLAEMERPGREGQREFFLTCWNGDSSYATDRIGRGSIYVPACCVSMVGGIQPDRLRACFNAANGVGLKDDGLIQRFQLLVWPDTNPDWELVDRLPNAAAQRRAELIFERLTDLDSEKPLSFRFAEGAQEVHSVWWSDLEAKVRSQSESAIITSHLSKYRSLMPSLAVLFQLADLAEEGFEGFEGFDGRQASVSYEHTRRATQWCDYLESHARRVYSCGDHRGTRAATLLAERIKARFIAKDGCFSLRGLRQKDWRGLKEPEDVKGALAVLEEAGWIRDITSKPGPGSAGGHPSIRYEVNPKVWD